MGGIAAVYWGLGVTIAGVGLRWLWPSVQRSVALAVLFTGLGLLVMAGLSVMRPMPEWLPPVSALVFGLFCGFAHYLFSKNSWKVVALGQEERQFVGLDIENSDGGIGMDIQSSGTPIVPSLGGESVVQVPSGQSAIGTRIIQSGPGIGMRVVQSGSGTGFKSSVTIKAPTATAKASGRSRIHLEDVESSADTLADAKDDSEISVKRGRHDPATGSGG